MVNINKIGKLIFFFKKNLIEKIITKKLYINRVIMVKKYTNKDIG